MQLFLPPCGYSCYHAANPATMWLFLLPCSCNPCHMLLLFLPITPFSCSCLQAVLAVMHTAVLAGVQLYSLPPLVWLNCPASVPASYHEHGHFIALSLQPPAVSTALSQSHANYIPSRVAYYSYFVSLVEDCRCSYS